MGYPTNRTSLRTQVGVAGPEYPVRGPFYVVLSSLEHGCVGFKVNTGPALLQAPSIAYDFSPHHFWPCLCAYQVRPSFSYRLNSVWCSWQ